MELEEVVRQIIAILDKGINRVGFVSPSHFIPQMRVIIAAVQSLGYRPKWIYNTNGYDKAETIRSLEGMIDGYLPDLKYLDPELSKGFSDASDYPLVAVKALKEMFRQKGSALILDDDDQVESGMIIRHLVLPGNLENSKKVLRFIALELSADIHLSLMSQYFPTQKMVAHPQLGRGITESEYNEVVEEMERLGMYKGWIQEFESSSHYQPDFERIHPFEK
jgi:putative pyruvate formate lyase activating enzyme